MPTIEKQIELEYEMVQEGIRRYKHQNRKLIESGIESRTSHGRAMIASVVQSVADAVTELQKTKTSNRDITRKKFREMHADQISYLSLITVVDGISKRYTLMKVARSIGMFLEDQSRLQFWLKQEGSIAKNVIEMANKKTDAGRKSKRHGLTHKMNKDGYKNTEWSNEERIHVGLKMVDLIITTTGIIALRRQKTSRNKTTTFVEATPETLQWLNNFNEAGMVKRPRFAPCIVPPKNWDGLWGGGYYSDVINRLPFVRAH